MVRVQRRDIVYRSLIKKFSILLPFNTWIIKQFYFSCHIDYTTALQQTDIMCSSVGTSRSKALNSSEMRNIDRMGCKPRLNVQSRISVCGHFPAQHGNVTASVAKLISTSYYSRRASVGHFPLQTKTCIIVLFLFLFSRKTRA